MPPPGQTEQQVIQWNDAVLRSGALMVFVGQGLRGTGWINIVDKAITELNRELSQHGISVEIRKAAKEADAQVLLDAVSGNELHAQSDLHVSGSRLERVTVRIPATPRVSKKDPKARLAGPSVRLYMLVHELIHALGLTNAAHSRDDVFTKEPSVIQKGNYFNGTQLSDDVIQTYEPTIIVPPIRLRATTIGNLQKAWR
jgi:hypothetical protein